jgi:Calpain family cysteine protease
MMGDGPGTGPFEHYPVPAAAVLDRADTLMSTAERIVAVGDRALARERRAVAATEGYLATLFDARLAELAARVLDLKSASVAAAGALSIWAAAVMDYNAGIDELNAELALAGGRELLPWLRLRQASLVDELDDAALRAAAILDRGPSEATVLRLFRHGRLPLRTTTLFPEYDFTDVDVGALVRRLQRWGDLPLDLDPGQIAAAVRMLERLTDPDHLMLSSSRAVLSAMWRQLAELDPRAVDLVVLGLSDDQLATLDRLVSMTDAPGDLPLPDALDTGLDRFTLADFHSLFLANASIDTLRRLRRTWPSIEPVLKTVDAIEDGRLDRPHWGDPGRPVDLDTDSASADDIDQGALGDCWMQGKLAAIADADPDWVAEHVRENANGTITVAFYDDDGATHHVTVTDRLPVAADGEPVFSGNDDTGARWADYYEKAFALISDHHHDGERGYGGIERGQAGDDADLMTGRDAEAIEDEGGFLGVGGHPDLDDVRRHVEAGDPVVVSTTDARLPRPFVPKHQFHVEGFTADGHVVLGNPWSRDEPELVLTEDEFNQLIDDAAALQP